MKITEKSRRILIIEDNVDSAETLKLLLEMRNHLVEIAFDGQSGIKQAHLFLPEIIVCDIGLPNDFDGYSIAQAIRKDDVLKSIYLIALSGYGQKEDVRNALEAGFDTHLVKPTDFDKLFSLIEELETQM